MVSTDETPPPHLGHCVLAGILSVSHQVTSLTTSKQLPNLDVSVLGREGSLTVKGNAGQRFNCMKMHYLSVDQLNQMNKHAHIIIKKVQLYTVCKSMVAPCTNCAIIQETAKLSN